MGFCLLGSQRERGSVPEVPPGTVQFVRFACGKQAVAVAIAAGAHCLVVCFVWWRLVERRGCRAIQDSYLLSSIVIYCPGYLLRHTQTKQVGKSWGKFQKTLETNM